jgi:transcriptional regulator with XRE-family HTH domain
MADLAERQARRRAFNQVVGEELRAARREAGITQADVAEIFGWTRDAISKIEAGVTSLSVLVYVTLVHFLRDFLPAHPAVPLARHMLRRTERAQRLANELQADAEGKRGHDGIRSAMPRRPRHGGC